MLRALAIVALAAILVLSGWLGQMAGDRSAPTVVTHAEVEAVQPWPGGHVYIRYQVRRFRSCATRVEPVLYDADNTRFPLPVRDFSASPGPVGDDSYAVPVSIDPLAKPGRAIYRTITTYACNAVHNLFPVVVTSADVSFTIQPSPP